MHAPRPELAPQALRQSAESELAGGEGRELGAPSQRPGGAGEDEGGWVGGRGGGLAHGFGGAEEERERGLREVEGPAAGAEKRVR